MPPLGLWRSPSIASSKAGAPQAQKWHEAPVDVQQDVLGQGRIGHRLASLIATLRTVMRLPYRQIQSYLATLHGIQISLGELVELVHRISQHVQPIVQALTRPRASQSGHPGR